MRTNENPMCDQSKKNAAQKNASSIVTRNNDEMLSDRKAGV